jgi:hypothetical protein
MTGSSEGLRDAQDILRNAGECLQTAAIGLEDLTGSDPKRRLIGLRNLVVFGRSITFILQTLRRVDRDRFNGWYAPFKKEMRDDALMKYFAELRNTILKVGGPKTTQAMYVEHLDFRDLQPLMENPPPGAKRFFIGDQLGGSGWEIELPDGSIEKYYVELPIAVRMETTFHFPDPPSQHLGQGIGDTSVPSLARRYLEYLSRFVKDAEREFGRQ